MSNDRGVAHVLGVILLAGFTITVAATVAVAGAAMFSDSQSQIESSQVEASFSSLAADASELEDGESVEFDLGTADGQLDVKDDTGNLKIYHQKGDETRPVYGEATGDPEDLEPDDIDPISINSLVYTTEGGDTVAYQGGGVFRQSGSGSSVVSAPDFLYRDNALSFPIQTINPDSEIQSSGTLSGELALEREDRHYPTNEAERSNPLEGGTVYVEMQSEYCQGWEEYFSQQTRGSISERCDEGNDGVVQVELSVPFEIEEGTFTEAVAAGSYDEDGHDPDDDSFETTEGDLDSADTLIDNKESQCEEKEYEELDTEVDEAGLYCTEQINDKHTFDTSGIGEDEQIEVYVDGDVIAQDGGLPVEGDGGDVVFYINGNFDMTVEPEEEEDKVVGNKDDPSQTIVFMDSGGYVFSDGSNDHGEVYAVIYAPESDGYTQAANSEFEGAMIVGTMELGSNTSSLDVEFDEDLEEEFTFVDEGSGPEFYYLHVTERTITASN